MDGKALADEIDHRIGALPEQKTAPIRRLRREYSMRLRGAPAAEIMTLVLALVDRHRWVAYELLYHHPGGLASLCEDEVERLGQGMETWGSVDAFGGYVAGPAWQRGVIADELVRRWTSSKDRQWRRAALVSTVALNVRSRGGTGDVERTLDICGRLLADRDDMVVKALSWALRELVVWDPVAVRGFLEAHHAALASRIRREVLNKLQTGLKNPSRATVQSLRPR